MPAPESPRRDDVLGGGSALPMYELLLRLRGDDGMVRGFSATGLGNLWAEGALPDLFLEL